MDKPLPSEGGRHSRRTKRLDVVPEEDETYFFRTSLEDESFAGDYEDHADRLLIHHFLIEGRVAGDDLVLLELEASAVEHPFPQCPFILPATEDLVGTSLAGGWRRVVLDRLGGAAGCTHVTTLLLGLSEVITLVYFQRTNRQAAYGPHARASGEWIARSIGFAPELQGACHALDEDSPVVARALKYRERHGLP